MKILENLRNLSSLRVLAVILLTVIGLHYLDFISINIGPFSTRGAIYVDSPEIYTRERLVNDRYDQDFWLRAQLRKLDDPQNLVTARIAERASAGIAVDTSSPESAPKNSSAPADLPHEGSPLLTFDQDFRIRAAIRDTIRQLMLENMLDDRHDLTGNSVYGLKFDTTVIPGSNTRKRAFVRVMLVVKDPFTIDQKYLNNVPKGIEKHVHAYYSTPRKQGIEAGGALYDAQLSYKSWLASIGDRLNTYIADRFSSDDFMIECASKKGDKTEMKQLIKEGILENIELVFGNVSNMIQLDMTQNYSGFKIDLPEPWANFMRLICTFRPESGCNVRPIFQVMEKWDDVYILGNAITKSQRAAGLFPYSHTPTKKYLLGYNKRVYGADYPRYLPNDTVIDNCKRNPRWCDDGGENRYVRIPSGLFNLIESIGTRDIYSYAVFPKNEVEGILSSSSVDVALSEGAPGLSWFGFARGLRESQIESVLVGFGDGSRSYQDDRDKHGEQDAGGGGVHFGWVMSSRGKMGPTQKTELALISVPAWTTELTLNVTTGWLDRNANEEVEKPFSLRVPVPPDFEAFDALVTGGQVQRKPKMLDNLMAANPKLSACENAKILIAGSRLWRSAAVTLGSQKADKITVLPNMEGIIAEFTEVEIPPVRGEEGKTPAVKLRVWTSEGVATGKKDVAIQLPGNGDGMACPRKNPPVEASH